jgi:hypothetical protein
MHTVYTREREIYIIYFPIHIHISEHRSSEYIQLQCPELVASYNLEITHWDSISYALKKWPRSLFRDSY